MNARLRTEGGHIWIECEYDAELRNWDEAIRNALSLFGQAHPGGGVICNPAKTAAANSNQRSLWQQKRGGQTTAPGCSGLGRE
jgi:hypothetical protein